MKKAMKRIFEITGCNTQIELAKILRIKQSSISDAIKRNSIPPEWLLKLLRLQRINPEWILTGKGSKHLIESGSDDFKPHVVTITEIKPPEECSSQDLINELVSRALKKPDIAAIQKEVADSWHPIEKLKNNP